MSICSSELEYDNIRQSAHGIEAASTSEHLPLECQAWSIICLALDRSQEILCLDVSFDLLHMLSVRCAHRPDSVSCA